MAKKRDTPIKKSPTREHKGTKSDRSDPVIQIASKGRLRRSLMAPAPVDQSSGTASKPVPASESLMISISGIRGVIGRTLTPEIAAKYGAAFGTWANGGSVVIGRDSRVSGPMVKNSVIAGLEATGCRVVDIGIVPTPTVEIATKNLKAHGGIAITASHNPVEWNALKLIGPQGRFLSEDALNEVLEIADNRRFSYSAWDHLGKTEFYDYAIKDHIDLISDLEYLDIPRLRERRYRVALDCVNGAGGVIAPLLLGHLGCDVLAINEDAHGIFPRNPEPTTENLTNLQQLVKESQCDIGFALDPDADRVAVVSEDGQAIGEEYTLALAMQTVLARHSSPVVINASTSMLIDHVASQHGLTVYRTRIGEIHVSEKMREVGSLIGGEGNGGVILPEVHAGRDACTGIALILQLMSDRQYTVSQLVDSMPKFVMKKRKIRAADVNTEEVFNKITSAYKSHTIDQTDGIKINLNNGWIHLRKSNTEPVIRIIAESRSDSETTELIDQFTSYFVK